MSGFISGKNSYIMSKMSVTFDGNGASISMLADLTGKTRRTITKRIMGLNSIGTKKSANTYDIKQALELIYKADYAPKEDQEYKPVTPNDWKAHFEAELKQIERDAKKSEYILAKTYYDDYTKTFKIIVSNLDTLADRMEAEANLNQKQKAIVQNTVRDLRSKLYEQITANEVH